MLKYRQKKEGDKMDKAWIIWLIIGVAAFIIEASTVSLVSVWFGISAVIMAVLSLFIPSVFLQIIIYVILTAIILYLTKPVLGKFFNPEKTNSGALIGKTVIVSEKVDNLGETGMVTVNGIGWRARALNDEVIEKGEKVIINKIEGVTLIIERID